MPLIRILLIGEGEIGWVAVVGLRDAKITQVVSEREISLGTISLPENVVYHAPVYETPGFGSVWFNRSIEIFNGDFKIAPCLQLA